MTNYGLVGVVVALAATWAVCAAENPVTVELRDAKGALISDNFYWLAGTSEDYRKLNRLGKAQIKATLRAAEEEKQRRLKVTLENTGTAAALEIKLTLLDAGGQVRVLPAYYTDNYVSLLPGESKEVAIEYPKSVVQNGVSLGLRGWNLDSRVLNLGSEK